MPAIILAWGGLGFTSNDLRRYHSDNSVEPYSKMVSPTFSTTLSLLSLAAPPQRVSQVTASVGAAFPCTTIPLRRVKTEFGEDV